MKNHIRLITILIVPFFVLNSTVVLGQEITPKTIKVNQPKVVNFKQLSDYLLLHPVKPVKRMVEQGDDWEKETESKAKKISPNSPVFNVTMPEGESRSVSPAPSIVFNGAISNLTLFPPDINGAAGNNYIIETTNQQFTIYTKYGGTVATLDIATFFSTMNGYYYYDPHVEYDAVRQHFVIISDGFYSSNSDGAIFIAVSETNDPTGNWYIYSYDATVVNTSDFIDYPLLGYNNKWVVITANDYTGTGGTQVNYYVLGRADLYSGTLGTLKVFSDPNYISVTPTQTYDTTLADEYLVQDISGDQGGKGYVQVGSISGTLTNPKYNAGTTIGVSQTWSDNGTIGAAQEGTTTNVESELDTKIENAIYRNGSLWFTHTVYLPTASPTYCGIDWWQVDPSALTVTQYGRIEDPTGTIDYYYPSINVDSIGNAVIGYSTSSPRIYVSSEYSYRASTDPLNTMESGYLFTPGLASYVQTGGSGRNRWGDFSFTCLDPVNNSFWTFQEFADTPANTWGTTIANIGGTPCGGKPSAGVVTALSNVSCPGEGTSLSLSGNSVKAVNFGYIWQQSSNGVNGWSKPTAGLGDSLPVYNTPPISGVTYFRCIETCGNSGLSDTTAPFKVSIPALISVENDTVCHAGNYDLIANILGTSAKWYSSTTSANPLKTGDTLNTTITKDTTFYITVGKASYNSTGIPDTITGPGSYYSYSFAQGLFFTAISDFTLDSVFVYANSTGVVAVNLVNETTGITIATKSVTISGGQVGKKTAINLDFNITGGTTYSLNAYGSSVSGLYRTNGAAVFPYTVPGVVSITSPINGVGGYYYFFYDWRIASGCVSQRLPVNVILVDCEGINSVASNVPSIEVYPNPADNQFNLILNNLPSEQYTISLYNILGEKLLAEQTSVNSSHDVIALDASQLASGIYFIRVMNVNREWTQKIIKR